MSLQDTHIHLDVLSQDAFDDLARLGQGYDAVVPGVTPRATAAWLESQRAQCVTHTSGAAWHPRHLPRAHVSEASSRDELYAIAAREDVQWIGETGLDAIWHRNTEAKSHAARWFDTHLQIAAELDKPLILHCVRAHGACIELVEQYDVRGIVHAFSGSVEMARRYERAGFVVGLGPLVTRKEARRVRAAAAELGDGSFVLETDAPYMATRPRSDGSHDSRGESGRPTDLCDVYREVAALRNARVDELDRRARDVVDELLRR